MKISNHKLSWNHFNIILFHNIFYRFSFMLWFLISIKARFQKCDSTRIVDIFGEEVAKSWPEFYADYDGTKIFWKFWDFDQNNPVLKFDVFSQLFRPGCITTYPNSGCMAHFSRLTRWAKKILKFQKFYKISEWSLSPAYNHIPVDAKFYAEFEFEVEIFIKPTQMGEKLILKFCVGRFQNFIPYKLYVTEIEKSFYVRTVKISHWWRHNRIVINGVFWWVFRYPRLHNSRLRP